MGHHEGIIKWRAFTSSTQPRGRTTQWTRHKNRVTRSSPTPQDRPLARCLPHDRDRHRDLRCLGEVATHDRAVGHCGGVGDAAVKLFKVCSGWGGYGDDGSPRTPAHGGQVRDGGGDRFKAQILKGKQLRGQMHSQNGNIRGYQSLPHKGGQNGGVVAHVDLAGGDGASSDDGSDTLQDGILAPNWFLRGNGWEVRRGQRLVPRGRSGSTRTNRRETRCPYQPTTSDSSHGSKK